MNSRQLSALAEEFASSFEKTAKAKVAPKALEREVQKLRDKFNAEKKIQDGLQSDANKLNAKLDSAKATTSAIKKDLIRKQRALQTANIAGAGSITFHDDTGDVSYAIDGKDHHIVMNDDGETEATPWRDYQRSKKQPTVQEQHFEVENKETDGSENDPYASGEQGDANDGKDISLLDSNAVDDLYHRLTSE